MRYSWKRRREARDVAMFLCYGIDGGSVEDGVVVGLRGGVKGRRLLDVDIVFRSCSIIRVSNPVS